jgi:hypothetical protein
MSSNEQLNQVQRHHILEAIARIDSGETSGFAESTKFDLLYQGRRYPPKRVAGVALQTLTGQEFGPSSFKGGNESSCFRALKRSGFTIVPKDQSPTIDLKPSIAEVLQLQTQYTSTNSPEMRRRGELIRNVLPRALRDRISAFEPLFTKAGFSLEIEGSDGKGLKNASAWVRMFDPLMSPSATNGWYVVLHFSLSGDLMYLNIGCGATTLKDGSLYNIPVEQLDRRIAWAKSIAKQADFPIHRFSDKVELHGNSLSRQFERAIAYAKSYRVDDFEEDSFIADVSVLCALLIRIYEEDRVGKDPARSQPEIQEAVLQIQEAIRPRQGSGYGQGKGLSASERKAVELRAMEVTREWLRSTGFSEIRDVSSKESFDFTGYKNGVTWLIEVKGTTSRTADAFLLTAAELEVHRSNQGATVLALVSNITLLKDEQGPSATGGQAEVHLPWEPGEWEFEPTAYRARRRAR